MAVGALKSLRVPVKAPAAEKHGRPIKRKPTNHMRPPGGGAFPLPSVDEVPLPSAFHTLPPTAACESTPEAYQRHGRAR